MLRKLRLTVHTSQSPQPPLFLRETDMHLTAQISMADTIVTEFIADLGWDLLCTGKALSIHDTVRQVLLFPLYRGGN